MFHPKPPRSACRGYFVHEISDAAEGRFGKPESAEQLIEWALRIHRERAYERHKHEKDFYGNSPHEACFGGYCKLTERGPTARARELKYARHLVRLLRGKPCPCGICKRSAEIEARGTVRDSRSAAAPPAARPPVPGPARELEGHE